MSHIAIRVDDLSKQYKIGQFEGYKTLREILTDSLGAPLRRLSPRAWRQAPAASGGTDASRDRIWALRGVSFEVKRGDVVGIIGQNGAGKSTLLKILSRITRPTGGFVELHGRVGSLLEVGTGFHPELTGRENIFLNGAVLGMKRSEIARKFDEIVSFAEVEQFIDTPVKRYSSGMYMRLAFSVAAHLEPEILIVDEVLAVGDAAFQKKCLGKIEHVAEHGRTVLFVSHNMAAIQALCSHCIFLQDGRVSFEGDSVQTISKYLSSVMPARRHASPGVFDLTKRENAYQPGTLMIRGLTIMNASGAPTETVLVGQGLSLAVNIVGLNDYRDAVVGVKFKSETDQNYMYFNTSMRPSRDQQERDRHEQIVFHLPRVPLVPGTYWLDLSIFREETGRMDYVERAAQFHVGEADVYGSGYRLREGVVYFDGDWELRSGQGMLHPHQSLVLEDSFK
jgi:lipopolysaccharide transport system ATP-binding protein